MTRPAGGAIPSPAAIVVSGRRISVVCQMSRCYHPAMRKKDEKRIAAKLAKVMAMMCVRNTKLENLHAGVVPVTKTGDYSDVVVLDAEGRKIPWAEVSYIDDT